MTTTAPLEMFGAALDGHHQRLPSSSHADLHIRYADGRRELMAVGRWCQPADQVDETMLSRCIGPTLDIGCGPGRLVSALAERGVPALGVDLAEPAVRMARVAGATALRQSVFEALPREGGWSSVLLADGNIGIGGEPVRLLRRCRELVHDAGVVVVELDPPGTCSAAYRVRLEAAGECSEWFTWAHVAADEISGPARRASLDVVEQWSMGGRWFACLAG